VAQFVKFALLVRVAITVGHTFVDYHISIRTNEYCEYRLRLLQYTRDSFYLLVYF